MRVFAKISLLAATMSTVLLNTNVLASSTTNDALRMTEVAHNLKLDVTTLAPPDDDDASVLKITPTLVNADSKVSTKSISIGFRNKAKNTVNVVLKNATGDVLFSKKTVDCSNFFESLNLKNLELGAYNLTVTKNLVKTFQPFELTANGVVMNKKERVQKFIPQIIQRDTKLDVNAMMHKIGTIKLSIYNEDGQLVFEQYNEKVVTLNKRYDLSQLGKGEFTAQVTADDEVSYLTIKL